MDSIIVIGGGVAGLSAAAVLGKSGANVTLLEKNSHLGGRIRKHSENGFDFDMGPSWYWMPDVFERFYSRFGKTSSDFYELKRLDPSYKVFQKDNNDLTIPADFNELLNLFESEEKGSSDQLKAFLENARVKYEIGMKEFVYKPSLSITDYLDSRIIKQSFKLDLFKSISAEIEKRFKSQKLRELLEFPVLFLGAKPENTPALYSMMNYADMVLGTWYPTGGMYKIAEAFSKIAEENNVNFKRDEEVKSVNIKNNSATEVVTGRNSYKVDAVINTADYHHFDQNILPKEFSQYSKEYWDKKTFAPSCILYYVGVNKGLKNLEHHNLFFDADFKKHADHIYNSHQWTEDPLFYVSCTSKTDNTAPDNCENLFILIPTSVEIEENDEIIDNYFNKVIDRIEKQIGQNFKEDIIYKRTFSRKNFIEEYNSFKGNAYGLANTLMQTGFLKPKMKNNKITNLYYAGQLTVPGPGLPPSIISGQVAADLLIKERK